MLQKVNHEHFSVVYTMKLSWNKYFMKCSERNISRCILAFTKVKLVTKIKKLNRFYFGTLVLVSYCYCGIMHKIRTSCKTLASKKAATWRFKNLRVTINVHEKKCLSEKKTFAKQVVPLTYTLDKRVLCSCHF